MDIYFKYKNTDEILWYILLAEKPTIHRIALYLTNETNPERVKEFFTADVKCPKCGKVHKNVKLAEYPNIKEEDKETAIKVTMNKRKLCNNIINGRLCGRKLFSKWRGRPKSGVDRKDFLIEFKQNGKDLSCIVPYTLKNITRFQGEPYYDFEDYKIRNIIIQNLQRREIDELLKENYIIKKENYFLPNFQKIFEMMIKKIVANIREIDEENCKETPYMEDFKEKWITDSKLKKITRSFAKDLIKIRWAFIGFIEFGYDFKTLNNLLDDFIKAMKRIEINHIKMIINSKKLSRENKRTLLELVQLCNKYCINRPKNPLLGTFATSLDLKGLSEAYNQGPDESFFKHGITGKYGNFPYEIRYDKEYWKRREILEKAVTEDMKNFEIIKGRIKRKKRKSGFEITMKIIEESEKLKKTKGLKS